MTTARTEQKIVPTSVKYPEESKVRPSDKTTDVLFALDASRGTIGVNGAVADVGLFRDALATLIAIKETDLRYKGRDRAAYLAFLMKKGKKANAQIWAAQKAFIDAAFDEKKEAGVLDPVLTVDPDEVSIEVFSKDESAYARLSFDNALFKDRTAAHGTTFLELSGKVGEALERLPGYKDVRFDARSEPSPSSSSTGGPLLRTWDVPAAWLRGFLQVQSAATLPSSVCELSAIDVYNMLLQLRLHKAKNPPRGVRFELVPGQRPRVVLEPWELVLESHAAPYTGKEARVIKIFGRQRLLALARLLPYVGGVRVHLLGAGLPSFFSLDLRGAAGNARLTVALTGWTESSWSSSAFFDLLMPTTTDQHMCTSLLQSLKQGGPQSFDALVHQSGGATAGAVRAALQRLCLRGQILFDVAKQQYRPRALLQNPVDDELVKFGSPREEKALFFLHAHTEQKPTVRLTKLHDKGGEGLEIHGEVQDHEQVRSYNPRFTMDVEGRVRDAHCGCSHFRRAGMREGPCEHMIAIRIAYSRKRAADEALRDTPEGKKLIRAETRTFVRRDKEGRQTSYRVSLDDKVVRVEWGQVPGTPRHQRMWFDTDAEARAAYFARLDRLADEGFVDADRSSA